jgi:anaerobic magnesium-protoporphyrin IX monomethyl ester cyclase
MKSNGSVTLVGRRLEHNDHLGIGYLEAALAGAAIRSSRHVLNDVDDVLPIARSICRQPPDVVGLSLQDGGSAVLPLALGELLRRLGYPGHITAGGPFATLARTWLLGRYAWLDSVVRFAGEAPLLALVRALARGESVACVPGLSTRAGDGPPADVLSPLPTALVPVRHDGMRMLGRKVAHVCATRGCAGRCSYCGPAALQDAEVEEGLRAGHSRQHLASFGVGGIRRRRVADLADELAGLARSGHGYVYFVDEHVLPYREADALAWLADLQSRLKAAKVPALAFGCMLRAERVTQAVARRFCEVGLTRCFLGIEFPSAEQGRWFRRRCQPEHALSILQQMDEAGVASASNLMLVHPNSTAASIEEGLRFLDRIEHGLFDVTRMKAYHGTLLYQRLLREGRLYGNPLRWDYRLADPVAQRFTELLARVRMEAFGDYSLTQRLYDCHTALAVARRLDGRLLATGVGAALTDLRARLNAFTVESLRKTLAGARDLPDRRQADDLIHALAERARGFGAEIEHLQMDLDRLLGTPQRRFSPMAAAAASSLIFLFASASCGSHPIGVSRPEAGVSTDAEFHPEVSVSIDTRAASEASVSIDTQPGSEAGVSKDAHPDVVAIDANSCADELDRTVKERVTAAVPCFSGYVSSYYCNDPSKLCASLNLAPGSGFSLLGCDNASTDRLDQLGQKATDSLAGLDPSGCKLYSGTSIDNYDNQKLATAIDGCGATGYPVRYAIVLDSNGAVIDVRSVVDGSSNSQVLNCILTVLGGLTFPCLANTQLCPEEIIAE